MKINITASPDEMAEALRDDDGWTYLFYYTDPYLDAISADQSSAMQQMNEYQHTLLAYNYLYAQVVNGGFIQLIQNGYGPYLFENPFSEHLRSFGAVGMADLLDRAKEVYLKNRPALERETTLKEFSEMYDDITDFEPLESEFYDIMDEQTCIIRDYVAQNSQLFTE